MCSITRHSILHAGGALKNPLRFLLSVYETNWRAMTSTDPLTVLCCILVAVRDCWGYIVAQVGDPSCQHRKLKLAQGHPAELREITPFVFNQKNSNLKGHQLESSLWRSVQIVPARLKPWFTGLNAALLTGRQTYNTHKKSECFRGAEG